MQDPLFLKETLLGKAAPYSCVGGEQTVFKEQIMQTGIISFV